MNKNKMSTKEFIHHLENEEKRCQIRALASDDSIVKREQKVKENKARELRSRLQRLWGGVNTTALELCSQNKRIF